MYSGALSHIGNAPHCMIQAIAEDHGVALPSFYAYLRYATAMMPPLLAIVTAQIL
ncbi:MAG: sodium:proton antiporter [Betaproteobacteria bacterium]